MTSLANQYTPFPQNKTGALARKFNSKEWRFIVQKPSRHCQMKRKIITIEKNHRSIIRIGRNILNQVNKLISLTTVLIEFISILYK